MRRLIWKDVFPIARILKNIDFSSITPDQFDSPTEFGALFLTKLLNHFDAIETDLNTLLASMTGKEIEEIQNMDLDAIKDIFVEIAQKNNLKSFFVSASQLSPRMPGTSSSKDTTQP